MSFHKIKTLFLLGVEDLFKNMNVFVYVLMSILFALLYSNISAGNSEYLFSLCILLNIAMVPVALMGTVIAEEKEKNTLRTLMLNNVQGTEILFAKAAICLLFVIVDNVIIYLIFDLPMSQFLPYQLIGLLVGVAVIFFGALVGLLAKNQMSAGLLSIPFMLILMAPLFISMIGSEIAKKLSHLLPTDAMMSLFDVIAKGEFSLNTIGEPTIVILAWFVISFVLFNIAYKRVGIDN